MSKVPDTYIEPFVAYRAWNWNAEGITSLNGALWVPKTPFEATCPHAENPPMTMTDDGPTWLPRHLVPDPGCTCGMYAGINMAHLTSIGYIERGIHGEVHLWGRLYRHTLGWRAQFAYPKNFIVPANMVPFDITEAQKRLAVLVDFDVDIYLQPEREAREGGERIPLWIREYGYSQQGLAYLIEKRAKWYDGNTTHAPLVVGDRVAVFSDVNGGGIGVVTEIAGEEMYYTLFSPNVIYHKKLKDVKWNDKNWRWETSGLGWRRALERVMGTAR